MLTIHDLLKDPVYRAFLTKRPELPKYQHPNVMPFRLMVQLKGEHHWRSKRFKTYDEMFAYFKAILPRASDAALQTPALRYNPPNRVVRIKGKYFTNAAGERIQVTRSKVWLPAIPPGEYDEHHWCPYCRRPTVFKRFIRHHALKSTRIGGLPINPDLMRCSICGASENLVNLRRAA